MEKTLFILLLMFLMAASGVALAEPVDASPTILPEAARALIQQAGNADDDKVRLALLKEVQELPDLAPDFQSDLASMIDQVDQWINCDKLMYFYHRVWQDGDWDFGISEDSPLYPLTYLYRGRMLAWTAVEYSGIFFYPERCRQVFEKARRNFELAKRHFPGNRIAGMYLGEPIPPRKHYYPVPGAPKWAVYQREGIERLLDIVEWWIDNRQQEDGEFGGRWGDDCEMWGWWAPMMIGFECPKLARAQAFFSKSLMSQPHMEPGYTNIISDVEHSAEPSAYAILPMMYLDPEDPQWGAMALRLADLMENLWTGRNERGFLQFKSTFISGSEVDASPQRACDTNMHPRVMIPALLYWQRTGDERLTKLFSDWMDTWVDATARSDRGKPAGILPSALHWPDGHVGGVGENWWYPENYPYGKFYSWPGSLGVMSTTLLLTWHMTGDDKYLEPIFSMIRIHDEYLASPPKEEPKPGTKAWCAAQLGGIGGVLAKYRFLTGDTTYDEIIGKGAAPYVHFRLTGDREPMVEALRNNAEALRGNFEAYTSEPRYTDRMMKFNRFFMFPNMMFRRPITTLYYPDGGILYRMISGEPGSLTYFPTNAVRWLTNPRKIAALVTKSDKQHFEAEVFTFDDKPRDMGAEFYLLEPGNYELMIAVGDGTWDAYEPMMHQKFTVDSPRTRVSFVLPPRRLSTLKVYPK